MDNDYITPDEKDYVEAPLPWQLLGLQQTASGYGRKLTSTQKLGVGKRLYRIYVMGYSNSGSPYIIQKGKKIFIR